MSGGYARAAVPLCSASDCASPDLQFRLGLGAPSLWTSSWRGKSLGRSQFCRGSFLLGGRVMIGPMPRYFFILVYPDRIIGDPRGTVVPSDEVSIGTARTIMDDLLEDSGPV